MSKKSNDQTEIPVSRDILEAAATWLAKMIADGGHKGSIVPRHCEVTLARLLAALNAEK